MIDQHMMQRMASFRKLIAERDAQMAALTAEHQERLGLNDALMMGLGEKVNELDNIVGGLLRGIGMHEADAEACNQGFAAAKVKLETQYQEAMAELVALRDAELARLITAVGADREQVVEMDTRLTSARKMLEAEEKKRAAAEAEHEERLRKLRGGKYGEAKKLLAEMEVKMAKHAAAMETHNESPAEVPAAVVKKDSVMMCQNPGCGKIAKPWVLSSSGLALCLACARGETADDSAAPAQQS